MGTENHHRRHARHIGWSLLLAAMLAGLWLLPIRGQVVIIPGGGAAAMAWPRIQVDALPADPDQKVTIEVVDVVPWAYVLLTINGQPAQWESDRAAPGGARVWTWSFVPRRVGWSSGTAMATLVFYHDCKTGCVERGRLIVGPAGTNQVSAPNVQRLPTKLGVTFANPERNWHGRSAWDVELTYARLADAEPADDSYWGIDALAARVERARAIGLRVLVRVDYDKGQTLPAGDDYVALSEYLDYLRRLARDDRLKGVYGYVVGSGFNARDSNSTDVGHLITPDWYARLFNGYGAPVTHSDNAVQTIRAENAQVKVLVGPVRPWIDDQDGGYHSSIDASWLNYFNTLVRALDESARAKDTAGIPLVNPDGFALQAPGRPQATGLPDGGGKESLEPRRDQRPPEWGGAQAGFRVYQDWLAIINAYSGTRGLPAYIGLAQRIGAQASTPPREEHQPPERRSGAIARES